MYKRQIEGPGGRRSNRVFHYYGPDAVIPGADIRLLDNAIGGSAGYLETLATHLPVVWLTPRVEVHLGDEYVMAKGCLFPFALRPGQAAIFDRLAAAIAQRTAAIPNLSILDQPALLHFTMPGDFITCDALHWADGDHLSQSGRAWLAERLTPSLWP